MKFLFVLLLAGLAYTSPVPSETQEKIHLETHHAETAPSAQLARSFHRREHPAKEQVSREDLLEESTIIQEEIVAQDDAVMESIEKAKETEAKLLHSIAKKVFNQAELQSEEDKERSPEAQTQAQATAATSEGKLAEIAQQIKKELKEVLKKYIDIVNRFFPVAPKAIKA